MLAITHQFHPDKCLVMQFDATTFVKDETVEVDLSTVNHIVCLVHHKSHFGVFVVDIHNNAIVVYDGKDIASEMQSKKRLPGNLQFCQPRKSRRAMVVVQIFGVPLPRCL